VKDVPLLLSHCEQLKPPTRQSFLISPKAKPLFCTSTNVVGLPFFACHFFLLLDGHPQLQPSDGTLLADSAKTKRRTKTVLNTCQPQWNQSFIFCPVQPHALRTHYLEVTVWDYDRLGANEFLGEVTIDLSSTARMRGEEDVAAALGRAEGAPVWHALIMYGEEGANARVRDN